MQILKGHNYSFFHQLTLGTNNANMPTFQEFGVQLDVGPDNC